MHTIVGFHELRQRINGTRLFDIEEFSLQPSSCTVLSGANGSGKTTLMKIIAGLQRPESCKIVWNNQTIMDWKKARPLLYKHVVYLHQQAFLFDTTVVNNIGYGLKHKGYGKSQIKQLIEEALHWVDLEALADRHARKLSGGEKQRLALARAYVLNPSIMLMDEPTANLDPSSRAQTYRLIEQLKQRGIAILLSSHDVDRADIVGDRHVRLCNGTLSDAASPPRNHVPPLRLIK